MDRLRRHTLLRDSSFTESYYDTVQKEQTKLLY